jgi:hypothetical protein
MANGLVGVRTALQRDLPFLEALEDDAEDYEPRWSRERIVAAMDCQTECVMTVIQTRGILKPSMGYYLYETRPGLIRLRRMLLTGPCDDAAAYVLQRLKGQLTTTRTTLEAIISEMNWPLLTLYRNNGLRVSRVLPGHFGSRDGYVFQYVRKHVDRVGGQPVAS